MEIGTVICTEEGPSPSEFSFVVTATGRSMPIRQGQYVELETEEGKVIAFVTDVIKTNRYFMRAESVKEYGRGGRPLTSIFPADRWEYIIAQARALGVQAKDGLQRATFPPSPGQKVYEADPTILSRFLGLNLDGGVEIGKLRYHEVPVKLDLTKLLRKHVAVLAMSGAGKCLASSSKVHLTSGEQVAIGELAANAFASSKVMADGGVEFALTENPLEVLSLDKEMRVTHSKVRAITRRPAPKSLLKISMRSGREVQVTREHPLLFFSKNGPEWKQALDAEPGSFLAVPRVMYTRKCLESINIADFYKDSSNMHVFDKTAVAKILDLQPKDPAKLGLQLSRSGLAYWRASGSMPLKCYYPLSESSGIKAAPTPRFVKHKTGFKPLLAEMKLTYELGRFVGYLLGDGHVGRSWIIYSSLTSETRRDFARIARGLFGPEPSVYKRDIRLYSRTLARVLSDVFGVKNACEEKTVSKVVQEANDEFVRGFLSALFDSDGYVSKHKPEIELVSVRREILTGVASLLLRFGIVSTLSSKYSKRYEKDYYRLSITGSENLRLFKKHIGFKNREKSSRLSRQLWVRGNTNVDVTPNIGAALSHMITALGMSKSEVGRLAGLSQGIFTRYDKVLDSISRSSLQKIAGVLVQRKEHLEDSLRTIGKTTIPDACPKKLFELAVKASAGIRYRRIAYGLRVSEATVGRMLSRRTKPTENLLEICSGILSALGKDNAPELARLLAEYSSFKKGWPLTRIVELADSFGLSYEALDARSNLRRGAWAAYRRGERMPDVFHKIKMLVGLRKQLSAMGAAVHEYGECFELIVNAANSSVFWDKVTNVEEVTYDEKYVYDIVLEENHNFFAGEYPVVVHNSYLTSVVIEELLSRLAEEGRIAAIVVDVHGEYVGLAEPFEGADHSDGVVVLNGRDLRIGVPNLSSRQLKEFAPDMSDIQTRELQRALDELRAEMRAGKGPFGLDDVISRVERDEGIHKQLQQALLGWLHDLRSLEIFDRADYPSWESIVAPGKAVIVDLSDITSLRKKQVLVTYLARRLFNSRKRDRVPPFMLCLEEAHQFAPSEGAISKGIIETIAREGRKFYASLMLISQRPVRLSTTVLSQANTNIILRVTNPYDLEHIKQSSECITSEVADMISSLPVGEALIVGEAVNYPIFVKVRRRRSRESMHGISLEDAAREFERRNCRTRDDAKAFM